MNISESEQFIFMRSTSVMNLQDKFLEVKLKVQRVCAFKIDNYCQASL